MAFTGIEWIIVIIAIVLLLFGAKKIPEFARNLGKAKAEFQRGQIMVEKEIRDAERKERDEQERRTQLEKKKEDTELDELEGEELRKAALDEDIDPEGKTEEELRILIRHKREEKE